MPRVQIIFDGDSRGAIGAARQVTSSLKDVKVATVDTGTATRALAGETTKLGGASSSAEKEISRLGRGALAGTGIFQGFGRSIAFASGGFLGAEGLTAVARAAFDELEAGGRTAAQTAATLKSTGAVAGIAAKGIDALALSQSKLAGVNDNSIKQGLNWLLTFRQVRNEAGKGNDIFDQAAKATLNLAVAQANLHGTQIDLASSTTLIGKALNDPLRGLTALQRVGVQFNVQQRAQIKEFLAQGDIMSAQKVILAELNAELGGTAKAYGQTVPGSIGRARETFRSLSADLLTGLNPAIKEGADRLTEWADKEEKSGDLQRNFNIVIHDGEQVVQGFVDVVKTVAPIVKRVVDGLGGFKTVTEGLIGLKVVSVLSAWTGGMVAFATGTTAAAGAVTALDTAAAAAPASLAVLSGSIGTLTGVEAAAGGSGLLGAASATSLLRRRLLLLKAIGPIAIAVAISYELSKHKPKVVDAANNYLDTHNLFGGAVSGGLILPGQPGYPGTEGQPGDAVEQVIGAAANAKQMAIVATAQKVAKGPYAKYVYGGGHDVLPGPSVAAGTRHDSFKFPGFDCSGFVRYVMAQNGIQVPGTSEAQAAGGVGVPLDQLAPGDLVFTDGWPHPGHVGIYIGNGQIIEDPHTGASIRTTTVEAFGVTGARRYWKTGTATKAAGFTPHNPADVKTPPKKPKKVPVTQLPGGIQYQLANAGATKGLSDDITANEAAVTFLTGKLKTAKTTGVKAQLQDAINGYQKAITDARKTLLTALPSSLTYRTAKASATSGLADDIAADQADVKWLRAQLKKTTDKDVQTDLLNQIAGFQTSIRDARAKLATAAKAAAQRSKQETGISDSLTTAKKTIESAFKLDLLPVSEETKLKGQVDKLSTLISAAKKDGKISATELAGIKASWQAMQSGITDATQAINQNLQQTAATKWATTTAAIGRSISEAWSITTRDFGRETDKGLKAISDQATVDIQGMSRDFQAQMVAFGRETDRIVKETITDPADAEIEGMSRSFQKSMDVFTAETQVGLKALEVLQTPTEQLLAQRAALKDSADQIQRLNDLTAARDAAVTAEASALNDVNGIRKRGAESIADYNARSQAAQDALTKATADRVQAQKDLDSELYDEQTAAYQSQADAERKAADDQTATAQATYQSQRDDLAQSLQDQETVLEDGRRAQADAAELAYRDQRDALAQSLQDDETARETARQATADADAQAYQDRRDAQAQALQDLHDDQETALDADLAQWGTWIANKQKTYADFLSWLAKNSDAVALSGAGPTPYSVAAALAPNGGYATVSAAGLAAAAASRSIGAAAGVKQLRFARGGRVPGAYIGRGDSVIANVQPEEEILDRSLSVALRRFLANPAAGAGHPLAGARIYVLGSTDRTVAAALKQIVDGAPETPSYRSSRG